MPKFDYDYYSGEESEQFRYIKIPKVFFEDPDYWELGLAECILYGFLHEQVALSKQNGWVDEAGKTYVIRTLESIQKLFHDCSADQARSTLRNLAEFGLIEKKRRGQGKPDIIYVKNFVTKGGKRMKKTISEKSEDCGKLFPEAGKVGVLEEKKPQSRSGKNRSLEAGNFCPIDTNTNYPEHIETPSIPHDTVNYYKYPIRVYGNDGRMDEAHKKEREKEQERRAYAQLIRENLDYDRTIHDLKYDSDRKMFDDFYQLILEVVIGEAKEYKINDTIFPQAVVKSRFLKLTGDDVVMAMDQISHKTDRKSTRLNSSHNVASRMPSSA